jgi:predicted deacylase
VPDLSWHIAGATAEAGARVQATIEVGTLSDGSPIQIPVVLLNGGEPGPTLYVGAGVHGDEITSTATAAHFTVEVDPSRLRGRVICVPVQSPLAFRAHHRLAIQMLFKSPMDQFGTDPFQHFPGDREGNYGQRVAWHLYQLMSTADAAVDMHTPTTGGRYVPFVFLPPPTTPPDVYQKTVDMARAFSPDFILKAQSGVYVGEGTGHRTAAEAGIPAFGFEVGEGGHLQLDGIRRGVDGLLNVLKHLGMIDGPPQVLGPCRELSSMTAVRATSGGLWELDAPLGIEVKGGDRLGVVRDIWGTVVQEVIAPHDGPFMRATTFGSVSSGDRLIQIGVEVG